MSFETAERIFDGPVLSRLDERRDYGEDRSKGWSTMSKYDKPLTPEQIAALKDSDIDFSDIPELDEQFWKQAQLVEPDRTEQITLRVKRSVLAFFKATGRGYQTRMNQVLESYVRTRQDKTRG